MGQNEDIRESLSGREVQIAGEGKVACKQEEAQCVFRAVRRPLRHAATDPRAHRVCVLAARSRHQHPLLDPSALYFARSVYSFTPSGAEREPDRRDHAGACVAEDREVATT